VADHLGLAAAESGVAEGFPEDLERIKGQDCL
jgi:hypothetical protein